MKKIRDEKLRKPEEKVFIESIRFFISNFLLLVNYVEEKCAFSTRRYEFFRSVEGIDRQQAYNVFLSLFFKILLSGESHERKMHAFSTEARIFQKRRGDRSAACV